MAHRFAEEATTPVESTQGTIIAMLKKRGATGHMMGEDGAGKGFLCFLYKGLPVRLEVKPPDPARFKTEEQVARERRRMWRVMLLWVKAQLEAIDNDLMSPMRAFMPHLQLKDGRTVAETAEQDGGVPVGRTLMALPAPKDQAQ